MTTETGGNVNFNYTNASGSLYGQDGKICDSALVDGKAWIRHRVREVKVNPVVGPVMYTVYEYRNGSGGLDDGAWRGSGDRREFRGHPVVRVYQRRGGADGGPVVAYQDVWFRQGLGASDSTVTVCDGTLTDQDGLEGREYKRIDYDAAGAALTLQSQRWSLSSPDGKRRIVSLAAACSYPNDGAGPYSKVEYTYDGYGNVTQATQYGNALRSGDEMIVRREYVPNTTAWIVNKVMTEPISGEGLTQTLTSYSYDDQPIGSQPVRGDVTHIASGAGADWTHTYTRYDTWGNPTVVTDALGRTTRTQYDDAYHLFTVAMTNALTQTTWIQWDVMLDVPTVITDANRAMTYLGHDSFGRVTNVIRPGESQPAVKYTYPFSSSWSAPFVITTETRIDAYASTPAYQRSWTVYDGLGRVIQTQSEAENGWLVLQSTAYDARGLAITATLPYTRVASGGTYLPPDWNALPQSITTYDALARVTQVKAPDGSLTQHAYRDWRELALDANNHQTESEEDGLGRLVAVREYYGSYSSPTWSTQETPATAHYWHDTQGNLIGVQDAMGNVTRMSYDALGRKVTMDDPSMGHWEYRYDAAGNLITQTDSLGQQLTFGYDALNRMTNKWAVVGGQRSELAQYEYDQGMNGIGQRTAMTDTTGSTRWQYDLQKRVLTETKTIITAGSNTLVTSWRYDAASRVVTTAYPTGEVVTATYNKRGLATGLGAYLTGATYNAQGQPLQQNWGNGRATSYTYWPNNLRLQQLQVPGLLDLRYGYDKVGNIVAITDTINSSQVQTFGYDARDRLVWAKTSAIGNGQYDESYGYDLMGDIITRTLGGAAQTFAYRQRPALPYQAFLPIIMQGECATYGSPPVATLHQPFAVISTTAGFRAAYDAVGNMTLRIEMSGTQNITYTQGWDAENRLGVVTNTLTGAATRFYYDGDGKRVKKVEPSGATTVYVGPHFEKNISTAVTTTYYYVGGQRVAMRVITSTMPGAVYYLYGDHLGSTSLTTDAGGNWVGESRYLPYGVTRQGYPMGSVPTDFRFTGQREEAALGSLYDYGARFYSPALGRFISADTMAPGQGNPQDLNQYTYVRNNPLLYIDQSGQSPVIPFLLVLGAAYVGGRAAYEVGTLIVPGADQMRRDKVGGDTVLRVSTTIQSESVKRSIDSILVSAIIRHESAAFERRLLTPLPGIDPGLFANVGEAGQSLLQSSTASIGPAQMQLRQAEELEKLGYVTHRANAAERVLALLNEQSSVEYVAGMVQYLSDQFRTLPGFNNLDTYNQRRLILIGYNWGWTQGLRDAIAKYGFEGMIHMSKYDDQTLDEYLCWSARK